MTTYGVWITYLSVGFLIGVIGLAVDADRLDDTFEVVSWMAAWTLLSPLMLVLGAVSYFLDKFAGIKRDDE